MVRTASDDVRLSLLDHDARGAWDDLVATQPSFGLLQSWDWGTFKERLGWTAVRVGVERGGDLIAGAQLLVKRKGPLAFGYLPRGPVGAWLEPGVAGPLLAGLARIAHDRRLLALRIEPASPADSEASAVLAAHGYRASRRTNQPRATIVVDMPDGTSGALVRMHHKARYNIKRAERQGVTVRVGGREDLPAFHGMMRATGERAGFKVRSLDYYREQWDTLAPISRLRLFIASHEGHDLAANVSAVCGPIGAYLHGASANVRRDLNPNELLMWEAMRWAEEEGCRAFDLWGVPDEIGEAALSGTEAQAPEKPEGLWGVYGFKRRMGQRVELYTPAHDRVATAAGRRIASLVPSRP